MIFMHEKRETNYLIIIFLAISHFTSRFMLLSNLEVFFKSSEMTKRSQKPKTFQSQKKKFGLWDIFNEYFGTSE